MANPEHVEIVKQGADAIRNWQEQHPDGRLDLIQANLRGVDLHDANMIDAILLTAKLTGANLSGAWLVGANLIRTNLTDADLRNAKLIVAHLNGAKLSGANLSRADLSEANLSESDLSRANLSGAYLGGTAFRSAQLKKCNFENSISTHTHWTDIDLSVANGLKLIEHRGPSTIGIDTLYKSQGKIPDVFLRGCGVPEEMIVYHHSLVGKAFEFFSCFISFTETDDDFSLRLYNDLQGAGIRCWRWKEDARWGRTMMGEVDEAVRVYDKLVVICSENSLKAEPVIREIERALQREQQEGKEILFPIMIDDYVFSWKHELQLDLVRKNIGDFLEWKKPESYKTSLERLIRELRPSEEERTSGD